MIPIMQQGRGDCFRACVASILEISLDAVPVCDGVTWLDQYNDWLAACGLALVVLPPSGGVVPNGYAIGVASTDHLEWDHAVVLYQGQIVHDPAPASRQIGPWVWGAVFAATNPATQWAVNA